MKKSLLPQQVNEAHDKLVRFREHQRKFSGRYSRDWAMIETCIGIFRDCLMQQNGCGPDTYIVKIIKKPRREK